MKKITRLLFTIIGITAIQTGLSQDIAIVGYNGSTGDGVSIVATTSIPGGTVFYFTDNEYSDAGNNFNSGEGVWTYTTPAVGLAAGDVITFTETGTTTNVLALDCSMAGSCGTFALVTAPISLASSSAESVYAYSDSDSDPTNGVTTIHAVLTSQGFIPASEDPIADFPSVIRVDGFPASGDHRDFMDALRAGTVSKAILENPTNYDTGSGNQSLSTVAFSDINLAGANPVVTVTSTPASVLENSGNTITYTFTRTGATGSPLTVNFNVGGTATFSTDYSQSGAATYTTTNGTVTIGAGNSSAAVTITPSGDPDLEPNETVLLTVATGTGYDPGSPDMATGTIDNDDTANITPLVAVVGTNHTGSDAFSFVALDDIAAGTSVYFTENAFDMGTLSFSGLEAVMQWTSPAGGISRGEVVVVTETTANVFSSTCDSGNCGSTTIVSGNFSLASDGEGFFAYQDTDNDASNGITQVDAVLYTGAPGSPGGSIPAAEDPTTKYLGAVLVDGFPSSMPSLTEYDPSKRGTTVDQANFQNTSNWLHAQPAGTLDTTPFSNIIIATGSANPAASVTVSPASVAEDGATNLVFTFNLDETATSDITVNFTVDGSATFSTDYTVTGADTFDATSGSVVISNGTSSAQVTIDPTADPDLEMHETVEIMIAAGTGYDGGSPNDATGSITNDDTSASMPLVAITGLNHTDPDGFSFVAAEDIPAGTIVYFTEDEYDNTTLLFAAGSEAVFQWTSPGFTIPKGDVIVVNESGPNTFALTCSATGGADCGSLSLISGSFSTATDGETFYAYADDDTDPTNGVTDIYAVLFTGVAGSPGGNIPATEDPSGIFTNALVVDGFPASAPDRTEYDPTKRNVPVSMADFENISNWLHAQSNTILSTTPFTDVMIAPVDLELEKSVDNATPAIGGTVIFTVVLSNQGGSDATGVEVTDLLPSGFTLTAVNSTQGSYTPATGLWNIGTLSSAQVETLTLTATVNSSGDYLNLAEVTAANETDADSTPGNGVDTDGDMNFIDDPDDEDDGDGAEVNPLAQADLIVTKSNDTGGVGTVGVSFNWLLTITNQGAGDAVFADMDVILRDLLPVGPTYGSYYLDDGSNISGGIDCPIVGDEMICSADTGFTIAPGGFVRIGFTVTPNVAGTLTNPRAGGSCTVDPDDVIDETNEVNNEGSNTVEVAPAPMPDLIVIKENDTGDVGAVGVPFNWLLTITNQGAADAVFADMDVILRDLLPVGPTYGSYYLDDGSDISGGIDCPIVGDEMICSADTGFTIAPGGFIRIGFTVTPDAAGTLTNPRAGGSCTVDPDDVVDETNEVNNEGSDTVEVAPAPMPDLIVIKTNDTGDMGTVGVPFNWLLTITNQGAADAVFADMDVILRDLLPVGPTYGSYYLDDGSDISGGIDCPIVGDEMICSADTGFTIAPGGFVRIGFTVTPNAAGTLTNPRAGGSCTVDPDDVIDEANEVNNEGSDTVEIEPDALSIIGFVLVNADTNTDIGPINNGDMIDVSTLPTMNLNIRADATMDTESVQLILSGTQSNSRTENVAPYALFGDNSGNYSPHVFAIGAYNLAATPYSGNNLGGMAGTGASVNFEFVNPSIGSPLILVDSATDTELMELTEGTVINKAVLGDLFFGVIYNASLSPNGVRFNLSGPITENRTEGSSPPYSLFGDIGVDIQGKKFPAGDYTLVANPNSGPTVTVNFTVIDEDPACAAFDAFVDDLTDPSTCGGSDGEIQVGVSGFTPPLTYEWSHDGSLNSGIASGLMAGSYTVTVTDDNGCTETLMITLEDPPLPIVSFTAPADLEIGDGVQAGLGGGTPAGGVYSGPGVTDDGNGMTYSFDPAAAGVGVHTLMYTYTDGNGCTNSASDDVEVTDPTTVLSITGFVLVNADSDGDLFPLMEGSVIDISILPTMNLNIRANATGDVESVRLILNGASSNARTENFAPYALFGDLSGDYLPGSLQVGDYSLTAFPYSGNNLGGTPGTPSTINFSVIDGGGGTFLKLYPNPAVSEIQVEMTDVNEEVTLYAIQIHDMQGQLVKSYNTKELSGSNQFRMPVSYLQAGVYTVTVVDDKGIILKKAFVVNR